MNKKITSLSICLSGDMKRSSGLMKFLYTHFGICQLRNSFFILLLLLLTLKVYSQEKTDNLKRNSIFFEIGGAGGSHSMNYERLFQLIPLIDFSTRAGFGFDNMIDYKGNFNPDIVIPVMAGIMYGVNHKIEAGIGQTFSNIIETDINTGEPARMSNFSTTFNIGYRYQNPGKNILIRAGYTPYIEFNELYKHWVGISIGYLF